MSHELIFHNVEQGSEEWHQVRSGLLTGSDAHLLMVKPKSKDEQWGDGAKTLGRKIVSERLLGKPLDGTLKVNRLTGEFYTDNFESGAMAWGKAHEKDSISLLNEQLNLSFDQIGFAEIKGLKIGCSPDGLEQLKKIVLEMKHEDTQKVIGYMLSPEDLWKEHKWQCIHNMWALGSKEIILTARDPRLPEPLNNNFVVIRKTLDDADFVKDVVDYKIKAECFMQYVNDLEMKILGLD